MPDNQSPVLTPEMINFLIKEDGIPAQEVLAKLTPQERKAFYLSMAEETFDKAPFMPGNMLQGAGQAAGRSLLSKLPRPNLSGITEQAAPYAGGAIGAIIGGMVKHPLSGWSIGRELGKRLAPKATKAEVDPRNLLRGADSASSKVDRLSKGVSVDPPNLQRGGPSNKGRVPGKSEVVESGSKPEITSNVSNHAGDMPSNLEKVGRKEFTEVEKRANMFGGVGEGTAVKPGAKSAATFKGIEHTDDGLSEAEKLIQEIMKGKTGGSLPNNARRGAVLKSPKKR